MIVVGLRVAALWSDRVDAGGPMAQANGGSQTRPAAATRTEPRRMLRAWNRAHSGDRQDPASTPFERGVAAYNADDVDAAADAFEEAVRLAPGAAEAHINLGLVYLRLQRPEDAIRELMTGASLAEHQQP